MDDSSYEIVSNSCTASREIAGAVSIGRNQTCSSIFTGDSLDLSLLGKAGASIPSDQYILCSQSQPIFTLGTPSLDASNNVLPLPSVSYILPTGITTANVPILPKSLPLHSTATTKVRGNNKSTKRKVKGWPKGISRSIVKQRNLIRPRSAYLIFTCEKRPQLIKMYEGESFGEISKRLGQLWSEQTLVQRERFKEMSKKEIELYRNAMHNLTLKRKEKEDCFFKLTEIIDSTTQDSNISYDNELLHCTDCDLVFCNKANKNGHMLSKKHRKQFIDRFTDITKKNGFDDDDVTPTLSSVSLNLPRLFIMLRQLNEDRQNEIVSLRNRKIDLGVTIQNHRTKIDSLKTNESTQKHEKVFLYHSSNALNQKLCHLKLLVSDLTRTDKPRTILPKLLSL